MAVATPTMLPVPTVAARAVARAAKLEISPSPLSSAKISLKAWDCMQAYLPFYRLLSSPFTEPLYPESR